MPEKPAPLTPEEVRTKAQADKARRLAEALRSNLRRRKAAAAPVNTPEDDDA